MARPIKGTTFEQRLWAGIDVADPYECWNWRAPSAKKFYGSLNRGADNGGGNIRAHVAMWELMFGPVPIGMEVCHECDNPPCCNPWHLFLGTHSDNMLDCERKMRRLHLRGEERPFVKLTNTEVAVIKRRLANGETGWGIAKDYAVSDAAIYMIKRGRSWKHIEAAT